LKTFSDWRFKVLVRSFYTDNAYGVQSPEVVNTWASYINSRGFKGHAYELEPLSNDWVNINSEKIERGDVIVIERGKSMPYGNCAVVTSVLENGIIFSICAVDGRVKEWECSLRDLHRAYRHTKQKKFFDIIALKRSKV
jgi:hypothetical protein